MIALVIVILAVGGYCWMAWEGRDHWSVGGSSQDMERRRLDWQVRELQRKKQRAG